MANVASTLRVVLGQLTAERDRLSEQIQALQAVLRRFGDPAKPTAPRAKARPASKRRLMSAQARKAVSQRMKAYWAKRRAQPGVADHQEA